MLTKEMEDMAFLDIKYDVFHSKEDTLKIKC